MQPPAAEQQVPKPVSQHDRHLEMAGAGPPVDHAQRQQATDAARLRSVADPLSSLQTNLSAMEEAIALTAAAAVPSGQAAVSAASCQSEKERSAGVPPKQVGSAPATAAVAPKLTQPSSVQPEEHKQALCAPISTLAPKLTQQIVTALPSTEAPALPQQASSMPAVISGPKAPQPSISVPAGNLAPIRLPAVRTMISQASGSSPQLAAPAVLPQAPVPKPSPVPTTATAAMSPPAGSSAQQAIVSSSTAAGDANMSGKVVVNTAASRAGAVQSSTVTGQTAGVGGGEQVNVSAASAVTLDEARAAGTARQAALAVLDDTLLPTQGVFLGKSNDSLPDRPFSTAQNSSISAGYCLDPLPSLRVSPAVSAKPQGVASAASSFGRPTQMTGPLPASGAGQDPESPLGGRPSQSETAVTNGKGVATITEPQDLHAAHLVHVLQAHKASQQLTDSAAVSSELQPQRQLMDSLLAMESATQGADSGNAAGKSRSLQQQGVFVGKDVVLALRFGLAGCFFCASLCCLSPGTVWCSR